MNRGSLLIRSPLDMTSRLTQPFGACELVVLGSEATPWLR